MRTWARVGMSIELPDDLDLEDDAAVEAATKAAILGGRAEVDGETYFPDIEDNPEALHEVAFDIDPFGIKGA